MSYEEQITSKDKYPSIFLPQMAPIVYLLKTGSLDNAIEEFSFLQIFFATRADLKIGEYSRIFPSFD